jgi:hypothetical protein
MIFLSTRDRRPVIGSGVETRYATKCKAKLARCRAYTFNDGEICRECLDDGATQETVRMARAFMRRTEPES